MGDVIGDLTSGVMQRRAGDRAAGEIRAGTRAGISELRPTAQTGQDASNFLASLLGISGDPAQGEEALRRFRDSTGFQDQLQRGSQAITGSAAARGLLDSGATGRALQQRGQQMAQQSLNNFLSQLMGVSQQGVGASTNIANLRAGGAQRAAAAQMGGRMGQAESFGSALGHVDPPNPLAAILGGGG